MNRCCFSIALGHNSHESSRPRRCISNAAHFKAHYSLFADSTWPQSLSLCATVTSTNSFDKKLRLERDFHEPFSTQGICDSGDDKPLNKRRVIREMHYDCVLSWHYPLDVITAGAPAQDKAEIIMHSVPASDPIERWTILISSGPNLAVLADPCRSQAQAIR